MLKKIFVFGVLALAMTGLVAVSVSTPAVATTDRPIAFPREGWVKGQVRDLNEQVVTVKTLVQLADRNGVQHEMTITGGTFSFEGVKQGTYKLSAETNDGRTGSTTIFVVGGRVSFVDIFVQ